MVYMQHEDFKHLARTRSVFDKVEADPFLGFSLSKPNSTAGKVLAHSASVFKACYSRFSPMTFKFGITHDPCCRFHNELWGYKHSFETFERMVVVYVAANPHGPAFLEAALIDRYNSSMARHETINLQVHCFLSRVYQTNFCTFSSLPSKVGVDARISSPEVTPTTRIFLVKGHILPTLCIDLLTSASNPASKVMVDCLCDTVP